MRSELVMHASIKAYRIYCSCFCIIYKCIWSHTYVHAKSKVSIKGQKILAYIDIRIQELGDKAKIR